MSDWLDVVKKYAPDVAMLALNPVGFIASTATQLIADQFGASENTQEAITEAIQRVAENNPEELKGISDNLQIKLKELELESLRANLQIDEKKINLDALKEKTTMLSGILNWFNNEALRWGAMVVMLLIGCACVYFINRVFDGCGEFFDKLYAVEDITFKTNAMGKILDVLNNLFFTAMGGATVGIGGKIVKRNN